MQDLTDALARYIAILAESFNHTSRVEDRSRYVAHLAEAALHFSLMHRGAPREEIKAKVRQEQRAFGWGCLSGPEGEAAETAFAAFSALVIGE